MRTLHLFAGAGGGLYCDLILGHIPVCAVELNPYCCAVLRERRDEGWWPELFVWEGDVREFDPAPWKGRVDCIHAGFPCQDISAAGRGAGIGGEKSGLVSEVWRAIDAIRPEWVFLENSPAIRTRGRSAVVRKLVARGYSWRDGTLAAADVGAGHIRKRWWLLAHLECNGDERIKAPASWNQHHGDNAGWQEKASGFAGGNEKAPDSHLLQLRKQPGRRCGKGRPEEEAKFAGTNKDVANVDEKQSGRLSIGESQEYSLFGQPTETLAHPLCDRPQEPLQRIGIPEADREAIEAVARYCGTPGWNPTFADVCGVVDGLAGDVNAYKGKRIEALGNGQVPLAAAAAWIMLGGPIG